MPAATAAAHGDTCAGLEAKATPTRRTPALVDVSDEFEAHIPVSGHHHAACRALSAGQEGPDQARRDAPIMGPVVGAVDSSCSSSPRCPSCLARKLVVSKRGLAIAERGEGIR
jgi:hypothetical protein